MPTFWDFFGFGSKRRTALEGFDRVLSQLQVNPGLIDDGMRYAIYGAVQSLSPALLDQRLRDAAELISLCVLGPTETAAVWGDAVCRARDARLTAALDDQSSDSLDTRVIKLVLMKGIASPEVAARVELE